MLNNHIKSLKVKSVSFAHCHFGVIVLNSQKNSAVMIVLLTYWQIYCKGLNSDLSEAVKVLVISANVILPLSKRWRAAQNAFRLIDKHSYTLVLIQSMEITVKTSETDPFPYQNRRGMDQTASLKPP